MKKSILFSVLFTFISVASFAQITPIVKGGFNLSNFYGSDSDESKTLVGGRVGFGVEYPLNDMISLQPTLYLSHKGAKFEAKGGDLKRNAWYLDMPLDVQFRFKVAEKTNLTVAAGPYIAYGIFGKTKVSGTSGGQTVSIDWNTFDDEQVQGETISGMKRFDAGLNFEAGLEFGKFLVGGSFELGLLKVQESAKAYNSNFSINVGYKF